MFIFLQTALQGESATPSVIRLFDLGFEPEEGEELLDIILKKGTTEIKELDLQQNEEFWENDVCIDLIKVLLPKQIKLETVRLGCEFPYSNIKDGIPQSVQSKIP